MTALATTPGQCPPLNTIILANKFQRINFGGHSDHSSAFFTFQKENRSVYQFDLHYWFLTLFCCGQRRYLIRCSPFASLDGSGWGRGQEGASQDSRTPERPGIPKNTSATGRRTGRGPRIVGSGPWRLGTLPVPSGPDVVEARELGSREKAAGERLRDPDPSTTTPGWWCGLSMAGRGSWGSQAPVPASTAIPPWTRPISSDLGS